MKRVERLGSVGFLTVLVTFVFHLLAVSFNKWEESTCQGCNESDLFTSWSTGLTTRCYKVSMAPIFEPEDNTTAGSTGKSYRTSICVPNEILMVNDLEKASVCLEQNRQEGDVTCAVGDYDKNSCKCDFLPRTKLILATSIITSISLGTLIFLSHLVAFIQKEEVVKWVIPICYGFLFNANIFMMITLIAAGTDLDEDVNEIHYSSTIIYVVHYNETPSLIKQYQDEERNSINKNRTYTVKHGLSFGMEILAFHFQLAALVIYLLMFLDKRRPNAIKAIM